MSFKQTKKIIKKIWLRHKKVYCIWFSMAFKPPWSIIKTDTIEISAVRRPSTLPTLTAESEAKKGAYILKEFSEKGWYLSW